MRYMYKFQDLWYNFNSCEFEKEEKGEIYENKKYDKRISRENN